QGRPAAGGAGRGAGRGRGGGGTHRGAARAVAQGAPAGAGRLVAAPHADEHSAAAADAARHRGGGPPLFHAPAQATRLREPPCGAQRPVRRVLEAKPRVFWVRVHHGAQSGQRARLRRPLQPDARTGARRAGRRRG
ncbi:hypothetical protein H632_c5593p0, partial [Helicosporidium sp. ATCC 50920]